jgi:hypothetical protein
MKPVVVQWFQQQLREVSVEGIHLQVLQRDDWLDAHVDYVSPPSPTTIPERFTCKQALYIQKAVSCKRV